MKCPACKSVSIEVIKTVQEDALAIARRRRCKRCGHQWHTREQQAPITIKISGSRAWVVEL